MLARDADASAAKAAAIKVYDQRTGATALPQSGIQAPSAIAAQAGGARPPSGNVRLQRQSELNSLRGVGNASTALAALTRKASEVKASAEGMKVVADLQQKPIEQQNTIDEIRRSVASGVGTETAADRLRRLAATPATV
jgi:hypothetical protein